MDISDSQPLAAADGWQAQSALAVALLRQAEAWEAQPSGVRYENGHCDSEMDAHTLREIVKDSASEDQLLGAMTALVGGRDRESPERGFVDGLCRILEETGHAAAAQPMSPRDWAGTNKRRWTT